LPPEAARNEWGVVGHAERAHAFVRGGAVVRTLTYILVTTAMASVAA